MSLLIPVVECLDNEDVGTCPFFDYCTVRANDSHVTGCTLPLIMEGVVHKDNLAVQYSGCEITENFLEG